MDTSILSRIQSDVESNQVMLYMKGTPVFPQCGFSAAVVAVLNNVGVEYHSVNVLEDPGVREGIKEYTNWPTIPQLYVNGEFVGGCDIIREMHETGELTQFLTDNGVAVRSAA
ncbi:Grx4 family monothiol glutaredoxin [Alphaproteobacteria bacterium]|jgi:monothiol glutaredoxin|nr:Grx4 family monothiol glutaredoxin [Alphaproteobacteria bacterium]MDG1413746.1 Grx4 family monothiol glutaredoxin [Alphaproteobacteria bacterium]